MIKVLIVDDEPKQREGLRAVIDWQSYGFTVMDTAANGNEALDKYKEIRPDLVIADIRMPGMDGLQLAGKLRAMDNKLHILILSGYADFDYAKKAMAHRADGYLMKPVDEDELVDYLTRIKEQIERERYAERWQQATTEWGREAFIRSLLNGAAEEKGSLEQEAEHLGLRWSSYQVLLLSVHQNDDELDADVQAGLQRLLTELFERPGRGYVFTNQSKIGVLLKEPILSVEKDEIYKEIQRELQKSDTEFSVSIGPKVHSLSEIASSYAAARDLNKKHFFIGDGQLLCPDMDQTGEQAAAAEQSRSTETCKEQLYYALEVGNKETMQALLRQTGQSLMAQGYGEGEIKRRFVELLTSILGKGLKQSPQLQSRSEEYSDYIAEIYKVRTLQGVYDKAGHFLEQMMSQLSEGGNHREVKMMLDLIHRNFSDNLKLETLSGIFNYNSAYLGKLFKNVTGEYFNTYLDKVRIEKAKALLEEGMKVYQVAEKVGYTNVDYFHTKFRKYVGTSPSAYRKTAHHA
ncbi:response regulator transcription factor [Paenibacillus soyae]|uniref:Response regulator transcription factor n=1 Tax=Paenibacillus soyae TaxID=2969249 RepID=A0A9X2MLY1_9BACL|nr:response regulator transcription factor [Paenibacillus soyae]MCR2802487.1 response regulator transcription factor [Paenibacillus soyae]